MATEERTTQVYKGTLRNILEGILKGISPGYNEKLKKAFFDAVNKLDDYDPNNLQETKKIIEFFGEFVSQSRGLELNKLNKLNKEILYSRRNKVVQFQRCTPVPTDL